MSLHRGSKPVMTGVSRKMSGDVLNVTVKDAMALCGLSPGALQKVVYAWDCPSQMGLKARHFHSAEHRLKFNTS